MKKDKYRYLVILAPLLGLWLSKFIVSVYGEESRIIIAATMILIAIIAIIVYGFKKRVYDAIISIIFLIPILIGVVGLYLDNLLLMITGLGLFFVVGIICIVIKKYRENRF